ncbi:MAG: BON domain-containing protein [Rhodanobacter sp.]
MKTRLVLASLLAVSIGVVANAAQTTSPQSPPPQTPPTSMPSSMMHNNQTSSDAVVTKVKHELATHGLSSDDISVTFQDGTATLTGNVAKHGDIKKAESAAMKVRGVKKVDTSGLEVKTQADKG